MDKNGHTTSRNIGSAPELVVRDFPDVDSEENNSGERLAQNIRLLWRRRKLLLKTGLTAAVAFALVAWMIPNQYEATARLMPPDDIASNPMALLAGIAGKSSDGLSIAGDLLGFKSTGKLFVGILRSRTVEDDLVRRFDLRRVYWVRYWEDARKKLESRTEISEDRKSGIISVTVSDRDRARSAALAQAYVDELNMLVAQLTTSSAHRERVFLEERLKEVKRDLDAASVEFSQFASKNTAIDIPEQGKAMVEAAALLQGQMIAAQSELSGLQQIYTANNVRVRSAQARVAELRDQLDRIGGKNIDNTNPQPSDDTLYPSIRQLPLLGVRYADLFRRVKIEEVVFDTLTKQYELAKVQEAKEIPTVKVLDHPSTPEKKSFPPRLIIVVFGTILCLIVATLWIIGEQVWTTEIHTPVGALAADIVHRLDMRMHLRMYRWPFPSKSRRDKETQLPERDAEQQPEQEVAKVRR